jgi:hypothetical protein
MVTASHPSQVNTVGCSHFTSSLIAKSLWSEEVHDEPIMHNKATNDQENNNFKNMTTNI